MSSTEALVVVALIAASVALIVTGHGAWVLCLILAGFIFIQ